MQKLVQVVTQFYEKLPRAHRVLLGSLSLITFAAVIWRPGIYVPVDNKEIDDFITQGVATLIAPKTVNNNLDASEPMDQPTVDDSDLQRDELDQTDSGPSNVQEYVISQGDTLNEILDQYAVGHDDIEKLLKSSSKLQGLKVGQQLSWTINDNAELQTLTWIVNRRETRLYERTTNGYSEKIDYQNGEWKSRVVKGVVDKSFLESAKSMGLTQKEISALSKALQWQINLKKAKKGDKFAALFSRDEADGKNVNSQLMGVHLRAAGKDYYAIMAEDGKFYDASGAGLVKGFQRYPMSKSFRITSGFNPRRLNPVTGYVAPHRGVDFSMPVGTKVFAVGDGEVISAKRDGEAGNYITIRHGRQYTTRYMHLKKFLVKAGQKVKRGDAIALSGNTGRSTGPHLHYELWVNNQAVNPITAKLPSSGGLMGKEKNAFLLQVKQVKPQLQLD